MTTIKRFRLFLGFHQVVYLCFFWSEPWRWFLPGEMVSPALTFPYFPSALHYLQSPVFISVLWMVLLVGWCVFAFNYLPKPLQIVLFILQISFHNANPLIIHEPQQLANFFLIVSIMWPSKNKTKEELLMKKIMLITLATYYFAAGVKKLPDINWLNGHALELILQSNFLSQDNWMSHYLSRQRELCQLLTWCTLLFELGFIFLIFTRYRKFLIILGIGFHAMIALTMSVGTFSLIMLPWYSFLIDNDEV